MLWQSINLPCVQVCKQVRQQKRLTTKQVKECEQKPCAQQLDGVVIILMSWVIKYCAGFVAFLRSAAHVCSVLDAW